MTQPKAPVALIVYKRPEHTRRTLDSLAANPGAAETDLIVFSDGPRSIADAAAVAATRQVVADAQGFKSVEIVERSSNIGLADNVVDGVTQVMNRFGRAIVLEDDIETSPGFLDYMNAALETYRDESRVWHISGWNYPISSEGLDDYFFWQVMNCWGWASWADRWQHYDRDPHRLNSEWSAEKVDSFNLGGGYDFFSQIERNAVGNLRTWAVFWYATIFEAGGLCLNPTVSYVRNIGLDGSGENCGPAASEKFDAKQSFTGPLPETVEINEDAIRRIKRHVSVPAYRRILRKVRLKAARLIS